MFQIIPNPTYSDFNAALHLFLKNMLQFRRNCQLEPLMAPTSAAAVAVAVACLVSVAKCWKMFLKNQK